MPWRPGVPWSRPLPRPGSSSILLPLGLAVAGLVGCNELAPPLDYPPPAARAAAPSSAAGLPVRSPDEPMLPAGRNLSPLESSSAAGPPERPPVVPAPGGHDPFEGYTDSHGNTSGRVGGQPFDVYTDRYGNASGEVGGRRFDCYTDRAGIAHCR